MTASDAAQEMRVCTKCGVPSPLARFYAHPTAGWRRTVCTTCRTAAKAKRPPRGARRLHTEHRPVAPPPVRDGFQRSAACDRCGAPIAAERWWARHCSRACLLRSVGLSAAWDAATLDHATEAEVRDVLGAVFAAGRTDLLATVGGAR